MGLFAGAETPEPGPPRPARRPRQGARRPPVERGGRSGNSVWRPATRDQQNSRTGHRSHRGTAGVQTVAPSSISAWFQSPGVPGAVRFHQPVGQLPDPPLERRPSRGTPRPGTAGTTRGARCHPPRPPMHRRRSRRSPRRCSRQLPGSLRSDPAVSGMPRPSIGQLPRGPMERAGAAVVAETRPGDEHLVLRGGSQRSGVREASHELPVARQHGFHPGLLEHHLRHPDAPGIRRFAKRERALVLPEPGEQRPPQETERGGWGKVGQVAVGAPASGRQRGRGAESKPCLRIIAIRMPVRAIKGKPGRANAACAARSAARAGRERVLRCEPAGAPSWRCVSPA